MDEKGKFDNAIDMLIRVGLLILLITASLIILLPFIIPLVWGVIIAVAIYPLFRKTVDLLNGKNSLVAVIFTFAGLLIIIFPSILLGESTFNGYQYLSHAFENNSLTIPPPTNEVKSWPLIGEEIHRSWLLASENLEGFLTKYSEQFKGLGSWLVNTITGLSLTVIQFIISIIIAGVLLAKSTLGEGTILKFANKLVGKKAEDFVKLITGTIRSVVQGILGIAFIQAMATAILLLITGVPFAGLWSLFILILAIMQLPPLLVLGPIVIYVFSIHDTLPASIFTVFAIIISISDSLLKPLFLGRGVEIPMMVVLLGAIGGMLVWGILGLFVGAVILALSYKLMLAWLNEEATAESSLEKN